MGILSGRTTRCYAQMQFPITLGGVSLGLPGRWAPEISGIAFGGENEYYPVAKE